MRLSGLIQPAAVWKNHVDGSITTPVMLESFFSNMARIGIGVANGSHMLY